jgi:hypothetical protein
MPDGSRLAATFKGYLSEVSQLPLRGGELGDAYIVTTHIWVLTILPGSARVGWIDP